MKQIWFFHGGDSFESYKQYFQHLVDSTLDYERIKPSKGWRDWIIDQLNDYEVLTPQFPSKQNAQYNEWKIYFEKMIPFFDGDVQLVGHSLGAMFLAKYLHENPLPQPVHKLVLLAAGYDEPAEDYGSFRVDSATDLGKSAHEIHLMHSRDDFVVPYAALDKYVRDLPTARVHRFADRAHFIGATFPELLNILR